MKCIVHSVYIFDELLLNTRTKKENRNRVRKVSRKTASGLKTSLTKNGKQYRSRLAVSCCLNVFVREVKVCGVKNSTTIILKYLS